MSDKKTDKSSDHLIKMKFSSIYQLGGYISAQLMKYALDSILLKQRP